MIISIELSDDDWQVVCEALEGRALDAESDMEACADDDDTVEYCSICLANAQRIAGYVTTTVRQALERSRPKFSDN